MFSMEFDDVEITYDKGFGLYFKFDHFPHLTYLGSPHYFSDGLGQIERNDGADMKVWNRGSEDYKLSGLAVPDDRAEPGIGILVKSPGVGHKAEFWLDKSHGHPMKVSSLRSRDVADFVTDVRSPQIELAGRRRNQVIHLHSTQAAYYFVTGGAGECLIRFGSFLKWPPNPVPKQEKAPNDIRS